MKSKIFLLFVLGVCAVISAQPVSPNAKRAFSAFIDKYLDDYYRRHPVTASVDGVHTYDDQLDSFSKDAVTDEMRALILFDRNLTTIKPDQLDLSSRLDYEMLKNNIQWRELELDRIRFWRKNPAIYSDVISNGLLWLALYDFAPAPERLKHVIAREQEVEGLLKEARTNISNPPAVYIKVSLSSLKGTLDFVESDVPKAFSSVSDPKLASDFHASTVAAATAIRGYIQFLEKEVQPNAKGSYAIGADNYVEKLKYQEEIDLPLDRLLSIAQREIKSNQEQFRTVAAKIDASRKPLDVWNEIKHKHPASGQLVPEAQKQLDSLIRFINEKKIVTIPPAPPVMVSPTPGFMRWSFASMWTPGPFEKKPLKSPYYITDVETGWSAAQKEEHLTEFNYPQLWTTSIHEAYPGHYVQGVYVKMAPSKVRKATPFAPGSYVEGWAHYCEQMMIDEGFGGGDPKIRMGQLKDALLRLCRFYVGISLHTRSMSVEEGTKFFMDNAFMEHLPAEREAERGTFDPTYLVYSVGKLEILKLRDDYKKLKGDKFSLQEFHNRLLQNGNAPIKVQRRLLLPNDQGSIL